MTRLFAEAFLVPLSPEEAQGPELRYDEDRALNVLPDGRPFIAMGDVGGTATTTRVRSEADDYDQPRDDNALPLSSITKVKAERDDFARDSSVGTCTDTAVRSEPDDEDRDARAGDGFFSLGTVTKSSIGGEPDDADRDARAADGFFSLATVTHTFVRAEAEDADRDAAPFGFRPTRTTSVKRKSDDSWSEHAEARRVPTRLTP